MKKYYSTKSEYRVALNAIAGEIDAAKQIYEEFAKKNINILDLKNPQSISRVYATAETVGIFEKAEAIRRLIYGNDMHFYGVIYYSDICSNNCAYCPGGEDNRKCAKAESIAYPRKKLTLEQIVAETRAVLKAGHSHICYLAGSPNIQSIENGSYAKRTAEMVAMIIKETGNEGLEEIILNIEPMTETGFRSVAEAAQKVNEEIGTCVALQFRVFQETYNQEVYANMHPQNPAGSRPKADYWNRRDSQARARKAGFDNIGLGVLLGLNRFPLEEIKGLVEHIQDLQAEFPGILPARVCLPSANELGNLVTRIPFILKPGQMRPKKEGEDLGPFIMGPYEMMNELVYALARLAMPEVNLVSSERDSPEMLEVLNRYASCTTLGVQPSVGGNTGIPLEKMTSTMELKEHLASKACATFSQATVFPRLIAETLKKMREDGWNPIFKA